MPLANRHFLPGLIWHITHRCHQKDFLLKFAHDRTRYLYWLFEVKKLLGLCVLNYIVTSNHVHLLVRDSGKHVIAQSMQLIAGRMAQEYNQRKAPRGAFWEDRYPVIDLVALSTLCGFERVPDFQQAHREWVEETLSRNQSRREDRWSAFLAIGGKAYVEKIKAALGNRALNREVIASNESHTLREAGRRYTHAFDDKNAFPWLENTHPWNESSKMRTG